MENFLDHEVPLAKKKFDSNFVLSETFHINLQLKIRLSNYPGIWTSWVKSHRRPTRSNRLHDRMQHLNLENVPDQQYPRSRQEKNRTKSSNKSIGNVIVFTCIVTRRSSIWTSFVRKSAPIVALYWLENLWETNWPMRDVFPTPLSPRKIKKFEEIDAIIMARW